jgi:hypothetical protein
MCRLRAMEVRSLQILALFLLGGLGWRSWPVELGLVLGGGVAVLNFRWLRRIMERVVFDRQWHHGVLALFKFSLLVAVIFLILRFARVNAAAFAVGLSVLLPGILWETLREPLPKERKGNT